MYDPNANASPFQSIPPIIVVITVAVIAVELWFQAGAARLIGGATAIGWRQAAIEDYAFAGGLVDFIWETGRLPWAEMHRFLTYPLVHQEALHAVFGCALFLALGKFVAERFSAWATLAIILASTLGGALAYGGLTNAPVFLYGIYPPVYGLIGAYTFTLLLFLDATGQNRLQAFQLIGLLLAFQLIFRVLFGGGADWVADVGGFVTGFLLSFAVAPGGAYRLSKLLERTRGRGD